MKPFRFVFSLLCLWVVFASCAFPQWSTDPSVNNPVCVTPPNQWQPMLVDNGSGGTIIAWLELGSHPGEDNIYAQNMDANGTALWPQAGVCVSPPVSNYSKEMLGIISDGRGGAIIAWYQVTSPGLTRTFRVQRVTASGTVLWGNGIDVALPLPEAFYLSAVIASDGNAGVVSAWSIFGQSPGQALRVYAQRIDSGGSRLWGPAGVTITETNQLLAEAGYPAAAGDGAGGVFVAWEDSRHPTSNEIYAQYIDAGGTPLWLPSGVRIASGVAGCIQCRPQMVIRTEPALVGPILAWKGVAAGGLANIYAQQLSSINGSAMWPDPLVHTMAQNFPGPLQVTAISETGIALTWVDVIAGATRLFAKAVDNGGAVWGVDPLFIAGGVDPVANPVITASGTNYRGAILAWQQYVGGESDVHAQYIDEGGALQWGNTGALVSTAPGDQLTPAISGTGTESAYITWRDTRGGTGTDVYAARVPMVEVPVLTLPLADATGISILPTLQWHAAAGASGYTVQVSADSAFTLLLADVAVNDTQYSLSVPLGNNTMYYWRVKSSQSAFSGHRRFTTAPPAVPVLNYPIQQATVYTLTPTLSWNLTYYYPELLFTVLLSVDSAFTPGNTTVLSSGNSTAVTTGALLPATRYYWKVVTTNAQGGVISYSAREVFTTYGSTSIVPTPSWPIGGAVVYSSNPALYWYLGAAAFNYTYEVRYKLSTATGWQAAPPAGSSYSIQLNGLLPGTAYEWEVRSCNGSTYSGWSEAQAFVTYDPGTSEPPRPVLSYPTAGVVVYTYSPTLYWYVGASSAGLNYTVEVSTSSVFVTDVQVFTGVTSLSVQAGELLPATTYYWRVKSFNGAAYSPWSATDSFSIYPLSGNLTPVLTWPTGGTTVYSTTPSLYWYTHGGASGLAYEVQYAAGAPSFGPVLATGSPSVTLPALLYGVRYFWRVRSIAGAVTSAWSSVDSFEVTGSAGSLTPIPSWPVGGALSGTDPTLYWYVNSYVQGMVFEVEYADNDGFSGAATATTEGYSALLPALSPGTMYYWRVRAFNGNTYSPYSTVASFATAAGSSPMMPVCGSPANGVVVNGNSVICSWFTPIPETGNQYEVQYASNPGFNGAVTIPAAQSAWCQLPGLPENRPVYWRVRSRTPQGIYSSYSAPARFVPATPAAAEGTAETPTGFALRQNYPNPFNPVTAISFVLPARQAARLTVYNQLGIPVAILCNGVFDAGSHTVNWDATSRASGIYYYELCSGTFRSVKKLILLK